MVDRVKASELAKRSGLSIRYFQRLAAERKVEWATQPNGPGSSWLFDLAGFEAWLTGDKKVVGKWRRSNAAAKYGTRGPRIRVRSTERPLKQHLEQLLKNACKNGSAA